MLRAVLLRRFIAPLMVRLTAAASLAFQYIQQYHSTKLFKNIKHNVFDLVIIHLSFVYPMLKQKFNDLKSH